MGDGLIAQRLQDGDVIRTASPATSVVGGINLQPAHGPWVETETETETGSGKASKREREKRHYPIQNSHQISRPSKLKEPDLKQCVRRTMVAVVNYVVVMEVVIAVVMALDTSLRR